MGPTGEHRPVAAADDEVPRASAAAASPPVVIPEEAEEEHDEDQEMRETVEGRAEAVPAPVRRTPRTPTTAEVEAHEDSGHVMYRSWCKECLEARATGGQHRAAVTDAEEDERDERTPLLGSITAS